MTWGYRRALAAQNLSAKLTFGLAENSNPVSVCRFVLP